MCGLSLQARGAFPVIFIFAMLVVMLSPIFFMPWLLDRGDYERAKCEVANGKPCVQKWVVSE